MADRNKIYVEMWGCFVKVHDSVKHFHVRVPFLKCFHVFVKHFLCFFEMFRVNSAVVLFSDLDNDFEEKFLLL